VTWDPTLLDYEYDQDNDFAADFPGAQFTIDSRFDSCGNYITQTLEYKKFEEDDLKDTFDHFLLEPMTHDSWIYPPNHMNNSAFIPYNQINALHEYFGVDTDDPGGVNTYNFIIKPHISIPKQPNLLSLKPCLGWAPISVIQQTLNHTTQYARQVMYDGYMKKHFMSRFPALNVARRHEAVATDTVFSDTPAIDDGSICAQLFVGRTTLFSEAYGMKNGKEFVSTLEDVIRKRGAMDKIISDRAQIEISRKVTDILRAYRIDDWQSEPHHQHQNFAERRYQTIKHYVNKILDRTGAPESLWLFCLHYV
jgi:hypothetical protein